MLLVAALLIVFTGLVHSLLGERYILQRLFRNPLPPLFGSDSFTRLTLRFAWHITTVAWFGLAWILLLLHTGTSTPANILIAIGVTFAISGVIALLASRARHLSWIVFGAVAVLCFLSASAG